MLKYLRNSLLSEWRSNEGTNGHVSLLVQSPFSSRSDAQIILAVGVTACLSCLNVWGGKMESFIVLIQWWMVRYLLSELVEREL